MLDPLVWYVRQTRDMLAWVSGLGLRMGQVARSEASLACCTLVPTAVPAWWKWGRGLFNHCASTKYSSAGGQADFEYLNTPATVLGFYCARRLCTARSKTTQQKTPRASPAAAIN